MKKRILPFLLIFSALAGLGVASYVAQREETTDVRTEASGGVTHTVCSSGCDFDDINQAFRSVSEADTIHLNTDIYDGAAVLSSDSTWGFPSNVKNLTIKGNGKDNTVWTVTGSGVAPNGHLLDIRNLNEVTLTVKDITFKHTSGNTTQTNSLIHIYGTNPEGQPDAEPNVNCTFNFNNIKVLNNKEGDSGGAGIYMSGTNVFSVKNSLFSENYWPGVSVHGQADCTVTSSVFKNNIISGIDADDNVTMVIKNNIISHSVFEGINIEDGNNIKIINNTIVKNSINSQRPGGISIYRSPNVEIRNNVIASNQDIGIFVSNGADDDHTGDLVLDYNDVWNNEVGNYFGTNPGAHDISSDPKFVSETDYHLQNGSPAKNAGDPDPKYNDKDGSRNDMGAYGGPLGEGEIPSPSDCRNADIWDTKSRGPHGPDKTVNAGDLSKILGAWDSADEIADIWDTKSNGPHGPDGIVNGGDLSRVLGCWGYTY